MTERIINHTQKFGKNGEEYRLQAVEKVLKKGFIHRSQVSEVDRMRLQIRAETRDAKRYERKRRMDLQLELCEMGLHGVSYKHYSDVVNRLHQ